MLILYFAMVIKKSDSMLGLEHALALLFKVYHFLLPSDPTGGAKVTTALPKNNNTAENQYTLLTLLLNTVVLGNCLYDPAPRSFIDPSHLQS
jgi:hypothetical protein